MSAATIDVVRHRQVAVRPTEDVTEAFLTNAILVAMVILAPVTVAAAIAGSVVTVIASAVMVAVLGLLLFNRKVLSIEA